MSIRRIILTAAIVLGSPIASAGAWGLVQVGPQERSLEIRYVAGACETTALHDSQDSRMVAISILYRPIKAPHGVCPAIALVKTAIVRLSAPLAGRHVEGGARIASSFGPHAGPRDGTRHPVVPSLIGLAPPDAKFVLHGLRLHAILHMIGKSTRLARVVSQSPVPGVLDPKNRVVRVNVLG